MTQHIEQVDFYVCFFRDAERQHRSIPGWIRICRSVRYYPSEIIGHIGIEEVLFEKFQKPGRKGVEWFECRIQFIGCRVVLPLLELREAASFIILPKVRSIACRIL